MVSKNWISVFIFVEYLVYHTTCQSDPWNLVPDILSRIKPPKIPDRVCNIINYGAIRSLNDNNVEEPLPTVNANTRAFANAIQDCYIAGGGIVQVPTGTFITSAITLKSNIALEVISGAVIRFTRDASRYSLVYTRWEGVELMNFSPFIYAFEAENITITGNGKLDGNSDCAHWWPWKGNWNAICEIQPNQTNDRNTLFQMAEDDVPVAQRVFGQGHYLRPQFIQPYKSKNVLIEGVTITNSPMWVIHPVLCENVIVRNVNIDSLGPNSDGIDPESCRDVWITGVTFNSGDDDIAIKSGRNADGRRVNVPSENIVIQNCIMADGHGGITLGSENSGGIRNVFAENCYLDSSSLDTAFRVKNNALRGGLLENFNVRNMKVGRVAKQVIEVDFYYDEGPNADFIPILKDLVIENVVVTGGAPHSVVVKGYPGHPDTSYIGMTLRNISFSSLTENPHFILENIDYLSAQSIFVDEQVWNVPGSRAHLHCAPNIYVFVIIFIFLEIYLKRK